MMLDMFRAQFKVDADCEPVVNNPALAPGPLQSLLARFGGASFNNGLYRIIRPEHSDIWLRRVAIAFPEFERRVACFGYDWLGRAFAIDSSRSVNGEAGVLLLEPGTGECLAVPANVSTFHNVELVEQADAALACDFYAEWRAKGGRAPAFEQCVGYKRPLFLGGLDEVSNLEIADLDVYWHLMGQLIAKTRGLPPGTPINTITME